MKVFTAVILMCLVVSLSILALPIQAQEVQEPLNLTIKPDGSIEPTTDLLERNGTVYTFKGDIYGSIMVQKSGVTIDGAGYTLQGRKVVDERGIYLVGPDRSHASCIRSVVKNLRISNFFEGIYVLGSSNSTITGNYLENAGIHLIGSSEYTGDLITHNTFNGAGIFVDYNPAGRDVITENNFINSGIFVDLSAPPVVDKNYWSNYTSEYPDAKELNDSGVWDTPNDYDKFLGGSHGKDPCIDYHPLVNPITDFEIAAFNDLTTEAIPSASPTPTTGAQTIDLVLVGAALIALIAIVLGAVMILKRKSRSKK
jgi:parallel beta-helix repeat protein